MNPSPTATTTTTTTTAISASLYHDALQSIYQFLNLTEFVQACQINKVWYSSGQQMKSRGDELYYKRPITLLSQSPLRHHITQLHPQLQRFDSSSLLLLQQRMDHLEKLTLCIKLTKDDLENSSPLTIPHHLHELRIVFDFWKGCDLTTDVSASTYIYECLKQIAAHSTRLNTLRTGLQADGDWRGIIGVMNCPHSELQTMSTLTDLYLPNQIPMEQQIDLIKTLPNLRVWFRVEALPTKLIQRLADGPNGPPKLEDIGAFETDSEIVDEAMAEQLKRLVTLTKLYIDSMSLTDPTKFLPHFPRLLDLSLWCQPSVNTTHLVTALSMCVTLTELVLSYKALTSDHVGQFLPHLKSLTKLQFIDCVGLVSLEFLTTAAVSLGHLQIFAIVGSTQMPINEYRHLRSISSSVEYLTIRNSSLGRFDSLTDQWTPGSKGFIREEWPKLRWSHVA